MAENGNTHAAYSFSGNAAGIVELITFIREAATSDYEILPEPSGGVIHCSEKLAKLLAQVNLDWSEADEPSEVETERLKSLELTDAAELEKFRPGSFGCHEALHTTSLLMEMVSRYLVEHPAIILDPELYARTRRIHGELFQLYQSIGSKHLPPE